MFIEQKFRQNLQAPLIYHLLLLAKLCRACYRKFGLNSNANFCPQIQFAGLINLIDALLNVHILLYHIFYKCSSNNFGANEVRARADVVATKLGIILSFFFAKLSSNRLV